MNKFAVALIAALLFAGAAALPTATSKAEANVTPQAVMVQPGSPLSNLFAALTPPSDKLDKILQSLQDLPRPPTAVAQGYFLNLGSVVFVACGKSDPSPLGALGAAMGDDGLHYGSGTGAVIGKNRVLTAAHVVRGSTSCFAGRVKGKVIYKDDVADIAVLEVDTGHKPVMPISCDGYEKGDLYLGIGYAEGEDYVVQKYVATGRFLSAPVHDSDIPIVKMSLLYGYSFEGMSGGPVIDSHGAIVGMVNAGPQGEPLMLSRALTDTTLCTALRPIRAEATPDAPIPTAPKDEPAGSNGAPAK